MFTRWTQHLTQEQDKEDFRVYIRNSRRVLDRLTQILDEEEKGLDVSEISHKSYDTPNWAYLQAHKNGYRQCLHILKKLINLDQQEHK